MGSFGLSEYFLVKYAEELLSDNSLGAEINGKKVQILKDKLILAYGKIEDGVTNLPIYQELNTKLADNNLWNDFHKMLINYVVYITDHNLKQCFNYGIRLVDKLNDLRANLGRSFNDKDKREVFEITEALKNIQKYIWEESKRILNLHDLRGLQLDIPEAAGILEEKIVPTWDYGPMKSPVKERVMKMRTDPISDFKKQMLLKDSIEAAKKKLGPYHTEQELKAEVQKMMGILEAEEKAAAAKERANKAELKKYKQKAIDNLPEDATKAEILAEMERLIKRDKR